MRIWNNRLIVFVILFTLLGCLLSVTTFAQKENSEGRDMSKMIRHNTLLMDDCCAVSANENEAPEVILARQKMVESSMTLLKNHGSLLPFNRLDTLKMICLSVGKGSSFVNMAKRYTRFDHSSINSNTIQGADKFMSSLKSYNCILLNIHSVGLLEDVVSVNNFVKGLMTSPLASRVVVTILDSLKENESLSYLNDGAALLMGCGNHSCVQSCAAQLLFGAIGAKGKLAAPFNGFAVGAGLTIPGGLRFKYTLPEEEGLSSFRIYHRVDSIVHRGISEHAFPGCQVLVAYKGKVIFDKCYGYHTYDSIVAVRPTDRYDFASVTKVTGALPALMKLEEQGKIILDKPFSDYWKDWKKGLFHRSNKSGITFREVLAHQAGLIPYINFYRETMNKGKLSSSWYRCSPSDDFSVQIDDHMYLSRKFRKQIYKMIRKSPLQDKGNYHYSGLSFFIYPQLVKNLSGEDYEDYLKENFYAPLGAWSLGYNPDLKNNIYGSVPTEYDGAYRHKQMMGRVHDEGAAIMGGVSGNAGLFGTANDLAKLVQMYMQGGSYGGVQFLKPSTLKEFSHPQFMGNRRGLGFDRPLPGNDTLSLEKAYPAPEVSQRSFGHSGFTGTFFWVDPEYQLVYVFLSNRVYPSRNNRALYKLNIRPSIQQVFYQEIKGLVDGK